MVRIEGELIKLLDVSGFFQQGGANQKGDFLEIFNKLISELLGKNGSSGEDQIVESNKPFDSKSTPINPDRLLASLMPLSIRIFSSQVDTKGKPFQGENLSKTSLDKEIPLMPQIKKEKFPQPLSVKVLGEVYKQPHKVVVKTYTDFGETKVKDIKHFPLNEENLKSFLLFQKVKQAYELRNTEREFNLSPIDDDKKTLPDLPGRHFPEEFRDASGVLNTTRSKKEFNPEVVKELVRVVESGKETFKEKTSRAEFPVKAYEIHISSLPSKVKEPERTEGVLPVIREALFREEGKVKRASVRLENLNLEVKLIKDRVNLQFLLPHGKENTLGFFDYLKISQILNSMGLRVESFAVNGQEFNRIRMREKEKDNINLNEHSQKNRDYLNARSSFSISL